MTYQGGRHAKMSAMTTQTTTAEAAGLVYDVSGDGPPLVLLHGLGSSSASFAAVVPGLADHFTTYALDLPGHGRSPMPADLDGDLSPGDLAAHVGRWMDELGTDRMHVAGNSMGGWVALEVAADTRALSVVALCPAGLWEPIRRRSPLMDINRSFARITSPAIPVLSRSPLARAIGFRHTVERPEMLTPQITATAVRDLIAAGAYDAAHDGMVNRSFDRSDEVPDDVPVVIAFGDHDRIIPAVAGRERDHSPVHARWITLERCGHVPMWDVPDETIALIRSTAGV
jgi:pimeloyl-ACP methyl ester carboxylesterase